MEKFLIPTAIILPFIILGMPYLVFYVLKKRMSKEINVGILFAFCCLVLGLLITYTSYKNASSMGGIYFLLWPGFAIAGGIPAFLIGWLTARFFFKKSK